MTLNLLLVGIELLVAVGSSPYLGSRDVCEEFRTRDTCRIRRYWSGDHAVRDESASILDP